MIKSAVSFGVGNMSSKLNDLTYNAIETGIMLSIVGIRNNFYVFWKKVPNQTAATIMLHQAAIQLCEKV